MSIHSFHIDHIIAGKHEGTDDISNLAWSCLSCNLHKGTDLASYDKDTGELTTFFNPRIDKWDAHFVLSEYEIMGKTAIGQITVRLLQMNNDKQIKMRVFLLEAGLW